MQENCLPERPVRQDGWTLVKDCFFEKSWPFIFMLSKHDSSTFLNHLEISGRNTKQILFPWQPDEESLNHKTLSHFEKKSLISRVPSPQYRREPWQGQTRAASHLADPGLRFSSTSESLWDTRRIRRRVKPFLTLKWCGTFMFASVFSYLPSQPTQANTAVEWIHHNLHQLSAVICSEALIA